MSRAGNRVRRKTTIIIRSFVAIAVATAASGFFRFPVRQKHLAAARTGKKTGWVNEAAAGTRSRNDCVGCIWYGHPEMNPFKVCPGHDKRATESDKSENTLRAVVWRSVVLESERICNISNGFAACLPISDFKSWTSGIQFRNVFSEKQTSCCFINNVIHRRDLRASLFKFQHFFF